MPTPDSVYWRNQATEYRTSAASFRAGDVRAVNATLLAKNCDALAGRQELIAEGLSPKARLKPI